MTGHFISCIEHRSHMGWCPDCAEMMAMYRAGDHLRFGAKHKQNRPENRTGGDAERAAYIVAFLTPLDLYDMARACERILASELSRLIEVRPERERREDVA